MTNIIRRPPVVRKPAIPIPVLLFPLLLLTAVWGCSDPVSLRHGPPDNGDKVTITQGVWGNVWFWEGDFMPVTPTGTVSPVAREILVYVATRFDSVAAGSGGFCDTIYTQRVTSVFSDNSGFFQVSLPPGKYSFFVREDTLYYANLYEDGMIQPATVYPDSVTKRQIDITYRATW